VVVSHDPDGVRQAGVAAQIAACDLAELRRWDAGATFTNAGGERAFAGRGVRLPTFEELLAEFPGLPINVDLKPASEALCAAFLKLVRSRRAEERVIAASFHRVNLRFMRKSFWAGDTALAQAEVVELLALPNFVWKRLPLRGSAAQLPTRHGRLDLTAPWVVRKVRAAGLRLDYWTVNDAAEATRLCALGVDGIMTDDPATVVPAVRAYGSAGST
jgi:glycerophosphoryl diester phosphodiesterase